VRYAIEGNRPGTVIQAAASFVKAEEDGSYRFTDNQRKDLERRGYKLLESYPSDRITEPTDDSAAKLILAEQKLAAEKYNAEVNRVPRRAAKKK
jgi:hypothetical protein